MTLPHIRGALLEEIILRLLVSVGYRVVEPNEEGTRKGSAGLELSGRGEWHQVDGLAAFDHTPAFMYPLRLLVEAKCYMGNKPVGLEVVRNALGVLTDVRQSYSTLALTADEDVQLNRFNYHAAICSTSGFTGPAQRYAVAHQIFLIQYSNVPLMKPIAAMLTELAEHDIVSPTSQTQRSLRQALRQLLKEQDIPEHPAFTERGMRRIQEILLPAFRRIKGSYFGVLHGMYPIHLICERAFPDDLASHGDVLGCKVVRIHGDTWAFEPLDQSDAGEGPFRLQFDLPKRICVLLKDTRTPQEVARVKRGHFARLNLWGTIGGIRRSLELRLEDDWLARYLEGTS
jgi:hypothetical protein